MTRHLPLLWIASVAFASTAHAEPTKVALAIEGDSSAIGLRKAVVGAFADEDDLQFVSAQKTTRAIEQLGIGEVHSAKDAKTVAKKLAVAAVVQGEFDESDHTLTLVVYANGKKTGSFTVEAEDTKSASFKRSVRKKMFAKLEGATNEVADDKADKHSKADKQHGDDEDVADETADKHDKADKKSRDKDIDDKANKKRSRDKAAADDKPGKHTKADKQRDDEDVAGDKADKHDKKTGRSDKDIADDKADKHDKADKKSGHGDKDIADDKADKHSKADKKRGDDEDVANDKADQKHSADHDSGDDSDDADAPRAKKVAADDDESGDEEDPTSARAAVTLDAPVALRNLAAMRVDLGASMMGRSLRFQSSAVDGAPSAYRAKPVPGGHLDAELYPLAFKDRHRVIAGLGIGGDFDQASPFTMPTADGTAAVKVTDRSYSAGARFRIAFGHRATSPTVTLGASYGVRTFAVDHSSGMTTGVPDVAYHMAVPSLTVRVPFGSRVTAFAGGRGILMLSAGPITNADQYGRANAMGGTATAGIEVGIASHVALRLAAEGTQIDLKFYGQGTLSSMLDGDPSTIDVQRARDRYYGGDATIAVTY